MLSILWKQSLPAIAADPFDKLTALGPEPVLDDSEEGNGILFVLREVTGASPHRSPCRGFCAVDLGDPDALDVAVMEAPQLCSGRP